MLNQTAHRITVVTSATILDKIYGTFGPPLPPISMMIKWRVFAPSRLHHCFGGRGRGLIVPFYSVQDYLGQNKWNIWTTRPPNFNDDNTARFCSFAPSSLLLGGGGEGGGGREGA